MSASNMNLLSAAFPAMLGVEVVPLHKVSEGQLQAVTKKRGQFMTFSGPHTMLVACMGPGLEAALLEATGPQKFDINIRTLTGTRFVIPVTKDHSIAQVKAALKAKNDIPIGNQSLIFNSVNDDHTIGGFKLSVC